jgi:MbtH protein
MSPDPRPDSGPHTWSDEPRYDVVRNDEEQYSVWGAQDPPPAGWHRTGFGGTRPECLAHIDQVWTDLRPLSVRRTGPEGSSS